MTNTQRIWLGVGSNLGDRPGYMRQARLHLENEGIKTLIVSSLYETDPWGYQSEHPYLNACMIAETTLDPEELMIYLKEVEHTMGRAVTGEGYADRPIDIDILFYGSKVVHKPGLVIPHERIAERRFVLAPLAEIDPHFVHPVLKKTIQELLLECNDSGEVKPIGEAW